MKRRDPHDWQELRAEAQILHEWLRQGPSDDPQRDIELTARAAELAALGYEATAALAATANKPKH